MEGVEQDDSAEGAYPEEAVGQAGDAHNIVGLLDFPAGQMVIVFYLVTVQAVQAVLGADPDISFGVLADGLHGAVGEAIAHGVAVECDVLRRRGEKT